MEEIWKDIEGYEGIYQVSSLGRVKRLKGVRCKEDRFIKYYLNKGYCFIFLWKNNKYKAEPIHRLVALAFVPNENNKPQVNHIDGVKINNCVKNLEWNTRSENIKHAYDTGLNKTTKVIDSITGVIYDSIRKASFHFPFPENHLAKMLRGERPNRTNLEYYKPNILGNGIKNNF